MNINEHTTPERLERYAFLWSLARMVIAAVSLFFGAVPVAYRLGGASGLTASLMPLFWLISGAAAIYLLYIWYQSGMKLFGKDDPKDKTAFLVMCITGINLGYAAIGSNIGINLTYAISIHLGALLLKLTAIAYLVVAYYLWQRWGASGERLFATAHAAKTAETKASAGTQESVGEDLNQE
jgi:hypothetical protein